MSRVLVVTFGEYSDYQVLAALDWLTEKTPEETIKEYLRGRRKRSADEEQAYLAWLVRKGYATDSDAEEFWVGAYSLKDDTLLRRKLNARLVEE